MKKRTVCKRFIYIVLILCILSGCGKSKESVVIYSSSEEFRNDFILKRLNEEFPQYDVKIQYIATGNNAAKLKAEGKDTECDIVLGLEYGYLEMLKDNFADLQGYDQSVYLPELRKEECKYLPWERFSGSIILNNKILQEKALEIPNSYLDLLKPEYKGLISMPNPKVSGTGYIFLKNLVNEMGEEEALNYFDKLSENILQFTSSGSGPVNTLVQGEAAIGLGMTFQAVEEINNGVDLSILYFEEGAPFTIGGMAIIEGKQGKKAVKDVFDFLYSTVSYEDKEKFVPEQIYVTQENKVPNYPEIIPYGNMEGINDIKEKEDLLNKWKY